MERLGIFGGTFNPPHKGHIVIAQEALKKAQLDKIIFIPCGNPPHKTVNDGVIAKHRYEMTRIAISGNSDFEITDIEVVSREYSYTAKTLKKLKALYPDSRLCFIVGGDSLRDMDEWYHPEQIFKMAEIVALKRGGVDDNSFEQKAQHYRDKYGAEITVVDITPMEIASTEIRQMIKDQRDVSGLLDEDVLKYINKYQIYKENI
jgi:nicotinate-nucleotide adenylyltransferase